MDNMTSTVWYFLLVALVMNVEPSPVPTTSSAIMSPSDLALTPALAPSSSKTRHPSPTYQTNPTPTPPSSAKTQQTTITEIIETTSNATSTSPITSYDLSTAMSSSRAHNSTSTGIPPNTVKAIPVTWKYVTFALAGLTFVAIVVIIVLVSCLCRSRKSLKRANTTMYTVSAMNQPTYTDPSDAKMTKDQAGDKVELTKFKNSDDVLEEVDSPALSPTPPPVRTLPLGKPRGDSEEAPAIAPRQKKRFKAPVPPTTLGNEDKSTRSASGSESKASGSSVALTTYENDNKRVHQSQQALISNNDNVQTGFANPAFDESEQQPQNVAFSLGIDPLSYGLYDDEGLYEPYEGSKYENTSVNRQPSGVFDAGDDDDDTVYEEPLTLDQRDRTASVELLHKQSSLSGLPVSTMKATSTTNRGVSKTQESTDHQPVEVYASTIDEEFEPSAAKDEETIDDLTNYDDIDFFADLSPNVSETSVGKTLETSSGRSDSIPEVSESSGYVVDELPPGNDQSYECPIELRSDEKRDGNDLMDSMAIADAINQDSGQIYENTDLTGFKTSVENQIMTIIDSLSSSSLSIPGDSVDADDNCEDCGDAPPMPKNAPPPLPSVPPRWDLIQSTSFSDMDGVEPENIPAPETGLPVNLNTDVEEHIEDVDSVKLRPTSGRNVGVGIANGDSNPRDSYFLYMEDNTMMMTDNSEPHIVHSGSDTAVLSLPAFRSTSELQNNITNPNNQEGHIQPPMTMSLHDSGAKLNGTAVAVTPVEDEQIYDHPLPTWK